MAKTLHLHLVAEGVETDAQMELLRARGCDELQGYLFSKPLPVQDFARFVNNTRLSDCLQRQVLCLLMQLAIARYGVSQSHGRSAFSLQRQ